jgi:hypothetical protein
MDVEMLLKGLEVYVLDSWFTIHDLRLYGSLTVCTYFVEL